MYGTFDPAVPLRAAVKLSRIIGWICIGYGLLIGTCLMGQISAVGDLLILAAMMGVVLAPGVLMLLFSAQINQARRWAVIAALCLGALIGLIFGAGTILALAAGRLNIGVLAEGIIAVLAIVLVVQCGRTLSRFGLLDERLQGFQPIFPASGLISEAGSPGPQISPESQEPGRSTVHRDREDYNQG